ncbi:MAG: hypothetical protein M3410_16570, partial [Acidobacteriota bacterium]|nr:hypothetical protein [Acidobacteriota bacterium]
MFDILFLYTDVQQESNAGHQRRARTAASDKPCMRDMLIARPLHAIVRRLRRITIYFASAFAAN